MCTPAWSFFPVGGNYRKFGIGTQFSGLLSDNICETALASPWRESAGPGAGKGKLTPHIRPISAHSTVMSPWSGQCSSDPFCTSGMRTSRDFWAGLVATYKVLTTLPLVECSQVRQLERKEEMRACPGTTGD